MGPTLINPFERIRNGDEAAFELLFRENYEMLSRFARKLLGNMEEAEELVQDLFVQLWDKRDQLPEAMSMRSYLFTAARNRCLNVIRHRKVRDKHQEAVKMAPSEFASDPAQELEHAELQARIGGAIEKLPRRCREVFRMSRFEGLKYSEIAEKLNISPRTVEKQIGKA
ncbi:MAG TPA: RNA polymerase sigma-70 factor, partial [Bacteroidetes bacterium]|nr:RNA polymerase sigma-70 factor [Bacteroidota bacterium]